MSEQDGNRKNMGTTAVMVHFVVRNGAGAKALAKGGRQSSDLPKNRPQRISSHPVWNAFGPAPARPHEPCARLSKDRLRLRRYR